MNELLKKQSELYKAELETEAFMFPQLKDNLQRLQRIKESGFAEQVYEGENKTVDSDISKMKKDMEAMKQRYNTLKEKYSNHVCNRLEEYFS